MVMYPNFKIIANGDDVTTVLKQNNTSISFKDEANEKADELTIKITDGFIRPKYEDELELYLGYGDDLTFCGIFKVQSSTWDKHQGITINATSVDFSNVLKQKRDITYEKLSIKDICSQIADRSGLELKSDFDDVFMTSIAQHDESDLNFLNRIARDLNAIFNIKNNTLYFMKKVKDDKKSDELPKYTISADECSSLSAKHSNKTLYKSCKATWHDTKTNTTKNIIVGDGMPQLVYRSSFKNEAEAKLKADAYLQRANQRIVTGSLSTIGQIVFAGGILELTDTLEDDGEYQIKSVNHNFSSGGWEMTIEFER